MKAALAAVCAAALLTAPALAAEAKGPVHLTGTGHESHEARAEAEEALSDARRDLNAARTALAETTRDFKRIEAGDWSGVMTIEGDKIIKCGDPSKYPDLNCTAYSEAEKAEMLAEQRESLSEAASDLAEAEEALTAAEAEMAEASP